VRIAIALLVLGACSGSTRSPIAARDLEAEYEQAECEYQARCGYFADVATCLGAYTGFHFAIDDSVIAEIDAKEVVYDGNAARTCVDSYANATCDTTDAAGRITPTACDKIFTGTLADSASCVNGHECLSQVCNIPVCVVACCAGTCTGSDIPHRAKLGEACTSLPCEQGSYCDFTSMMCVALYPAGTTCTGSFQCAYGTACAGTPKTCMALPKLGEACPDGMCRDDGQVCTGGTCVRVGLPGDACTVATDCSHFYTCAAGGTCGVRDPGGVCMTDPDCFEANTYCAAGACSPPQANGATCADDRECATDNCNDDTLLCSDPAICT
jgi:hypothetical protein